MFLKLNSTSYITLFIACMGGGLTGTFLNTINSKIVNSWFEPKELGIMMGIIQASLSLGQVIALALSGGCTYKFIFRISFIMGTILLILWIVLAKDSDREISSNKKINIIDGIRNNETIYVGIILFSLYGGFGTISSFLPSKLIANNVSNSLAGEITALTALARFAGGLAFPRILYKTEKEDILIIILLVLFPISLVLLAFTNNQYIISALVLLTGYIVGSLISLLSLFNYFLLKKRINKLDIKKS